MATLHFTKALVRLPGKSLIDGITSAGMGLPNYELALEQHAAYVETLEYLGLEVIVLAASEDYPDSCFIEDVALVTPNFAILTNPGVVSRNGEKALVADELEDRFERVHKITKGTLDGGDVMMVGDHFFVGLSERTNLQGAEELEAILANEGRTLDTISMSEMLHLKTGVSYLENNLLLTCGEFIDEHKFDYLDQIEVPLDEAYSANSLWINGTVIVPSGFETVAAQLQRRGVQVIELQMSEFQKLDGGLSCLSLRY